MMRRMQKKDIQEKKIIEKAAIKAAADNETRSAQIDLEELERIRKRQAGEAVTLETFNKWKAAFDEEQLKLRMLSASKEPEDSRPTGKQWFLMQKAAGNLTGDSDEVEDLILEGENEEITEEQLEMGLKMLEEMAGEDDDEDDEDYVDEDGDDKLDVEDI